MSGRRRVVVTGTGLVGALGEDRRELHRALVRGESAVGRAAGEGPRSRLATAGIESFDARGHLGGANLRALDRTARLTCAAARLALEEAGWDPEDGAIETGLVLGTMFGSVATISGFDRRALAAGPNYAKPMDFANSVINAAAGQTAIRFGLKGANATISGGVTSGAQAIAFAVDQIADGRAERLLAGGAEELCEESLLVFSRARLLAGSANGHGPRPVPFAAGRNGFALGEGAALLALESRQSALDRGAAILAEITGAGAGFDPGRGREEAARVESIARAWRRALAAAGVEPSQISCLSASANGDPARDRSEALAVSEVFGAVGPPVAAVKSMVGEALGASAAIQAVALVESLATGELPGVGGLEAPDPELPPLDAAPSARSLPLHRGLLSAVGLEGKAAALVIERTREGSH